MNSSSILYVLLTLSVFFISACDDSSSTAETTLSTQDSISVEIGELDSLENTEVEAAASLTGKWRNVGMRLGNMFLSADDIARPNRTFTPEGKMIISPLGVEAVISDFVYEDHLIKSNQEGKEIVSLLTADSLIIISVIDGEESQYIYLRVN